MANPIRIIADVPSRNPGLGFPEYAEALADAIRGGEPPQFTIGLYGAWGSGKSSLLFALADILSKGSDVVPVLFDAWRYEKSDHIIVPLLHKIYATVNAQGLTKIKDHLQRALASVVYGLSFSLGAVGLGIDPKDMLEAWESKGLVPLDHAYAKPYAELQALAKALDGRRIAVLIDDLDRCSPGKTVSVLENIKLVMDVPGFIFVLALDYEVLIKAVEAHYPNVAGDVFIQKVIQLPFRVPPLNIEAPDFLSELIPGGARGKSIFPRALHDQTRDIALLGLQSNPRQIKRLINSFLLLERVMQQRELAADNRLLLSLIGVQLRWPSQYRDFQDAVLAEDQNPFQNLGGDEDEPDLQRYAERFFKGKFKTADLKQLVQLTAVVAVEEQEADVADVSLAALREPKRQEFIGQLKERGFDRSPRSDRLYYNPDKPGMRFVIGKHVVRFEKKQRGEWRLWESYLLTRETDLALQVIADPNRHFSNRT